MGEMRIKLVSYLQLFSLYNTHPSIAALNTKLLNIKNIIVNYFLNDVGERDALFNLTNEIFIKSINK